MSNSFGILPAALIIKDMSFYSNQCADSDSRWVRLFPDSEPAEVFACTPLRLCEIFYSCTSEGG
jgi:hypothetical protein